MAIHVNAYVHEGHPPISQKQSNNLAMQRFNRILNFEGVPRRRTCPMQGVSLTDARVGVPRRRTR